MKLVFLAESEVREAEVVSTEFEDNVTIYEVIDFMKRFLEVSDFFKTKFYFRDSDYTVEKREASEKNVGNRIA